LWLLSRSSNLRQNASWKAENYMKKKTPEFVSTVQESGDAATFPNISEYRSMCQLHWLSCVGRGVHYIAPCTAWIGSQKSASRLGGGCFCIVLVDLLQNPLVSLSLSAIVHLCKFCIASISNVFYSAAFKLNIFDFDEGYFYYDNVGSFG